MTYGTSSYSMWIKMKWSPKKLPVCASLMIHLRRGPRCWKRPEGFSMMECAAGTNRAVPLLFSTPRLGSHDGSEAFCSAT